MESNPVTTSKKPSLINLQLGWPSPRLFAASGLLDGATQVLISESETAAALIYGPHVGHPPLRESVAGWLSSVYGTNIDHEWISINNGASDNLANILLKFTDPFYARKIFMTEGVPENNTKGISIEFLDRELSKVETEVQAITNYKKADQPDKPTLKVGKSYPKIFKYVIYLVPTFSNPSRKTLSLQMRKDLALFARRYDALIVSDDVYDFLSWPDDPHTQDCTAIAVPPRLVDIDRRITGYSTWGNTVSNGSFSKVIGPGVRVGWADSAPAFATELAEVGFSSSGGAPSHLTSTFVDKMLRSGNLQAHIKDTLIPTYSERYYALMFSINDLLVPLGVVNEAKNPNTTAATAGGFFAYLRLPEDLPAARTVAAIALEETQLRIAFGHMFAVTGDNNSVLRGESKNGFAQCIRLCWAWHEIAEIKEGIVRLAGTIQDIRTRMKNGERFDEQAAIGIR